MRKSLIIAVVIGVYVLWKSLRSLELASQGHLVLRSSVPFPMKNCLGLCRDDGGSRSEEFTNLNESTSIEERVLILSKRPSMTKTLIPVLEANRIPYDVHYLVGVESDVLPSFTVGNVGKYSGIVFTSFSYYFTLNSWNKRLLDKYCSSYAVGIVLFNQGEGKSTRLVDNFPFKVHTNIRQFKSYRVNGNATILRLVKADKVLESDEQIDFKFKWSVFIPQNNNFLRQFEIVCASSFIENPQRYQRGNDMRTTLAENPVDYPVVVHDLGITDGIHKVYFGAGLTFWPHKLLFMDALGFVSRHKLAKSLDRWIMVDIDDIFVGREGIRMKKEDVKVSTHRSHFELAI